MTERSQDRLLAEALSGQVVHTHVPLSPSSINWYWSKGGDGSGWEVNHGSGGR